MPVAKIRKGWKGYLDKARKKMFPQKKGTAPGKMDYDVGGALSRRKKALEDSLKY